MIEYVFADPGCSCTVKVDGCHYEIPEFENNRAQLDHLLSVLDKIAEDKNSRIAKILVVGSASPDGSAELNSRIAANRAQVLVDRKSTRLNSSHNRESRMPSSA